MTRYRFFTATSLDGFLADEHDSLDWLLSQPTGEEGILPYDRFIGEVGAIVGVGPRLVGRIMGTWGSSVPWWRVTNASGDHPLLARALPHWQEEGITVKPNGLGCRMKDFGADLEQLRADAAPALAELKEAGA